MANQASNVNWSLACVAKSFPTFWQALNQLGPAVDLTTAAGPAA